MSSRTVLSRIGLAVVIAGLLMPACRKKQEEVNPIEAKITVNRVRAPLGSPIEVTYTWKCEPGMKKLGQEYHAFVHFLDSHGLTLFADDHLPSPPPFQWEPGKEYSYTRTVFIPVYPYVGEVEMRMGLYPSNGRGPRVAMKGDDAGLYEYRIAKMEFLPQTENIYLVEKEGWHNPESSPQTPGFERIWTKREALISFKNPKKDVIFYLEADTNFKAFQKPPVLTLSVNGKVGVTIPIKDSEIFMKKVLFKAADLGTGDWADLRFTLNQGFVPMTLGINNDDRELGLLVYHRAVVEAEKVGALPAGSVMDAGPLPADMIAALKNPIVKAVPAPAAGAKTAPSPTVTGAKSTTTAAPAAKAASSPAAAGKPAATPASAAKGAAPAPAKK